MASMKIGLKDVPGDNCIFAGKDFIFKALYYGDKITMIPGVIVTL